MRDANSFDLVVIGAGSGGLVAARFAARLGAKVALVERGRIGGDCTWAGCVPSKALLKAAKVAHTVRTARDFGIAADSVTVDMGRVRDYVRRAVEAAHRFETPEVLRGEGIEVVNAPTRFVDASSVRAGERLLRARRLLVTTGARARIPDIAGLKDVPFLTYEDVFDNAVLPEHLVVVGGGPLGAELAQAYRRLGSEVTLVAERFLPKESPEVQALMRGVFEAEGIRLVAGRAASARKENDSIVVETQDSRTARGDRLLVATGRRPNVEDLELAAAGVEHASGGIPVDAQLRTNVKHIFAAGDVVGGPQYTHYAGWQAFHAVRNALLPGSAKGTAAHVPRVTFTDPEVAQVGLTPEAASRHDPGIAVHVWNFDRVDRAVCDNAAAGLVKVITRRNGTVIGASLVGPRAGEAIAELALAIDKRLTLADIAGTIHAYPTYATPVQQLASDASVERFLSGVPGRIVAALKGFRPRPG